MNTIENLIAATRREAESAELPIDRPIYERAQKDPLDPILYGGSLAAHVAFLGRDLGKDEVARGQPLVGAGGRLVREGIYRAIEHTSPPRDDRMLESTLQHALLTNTVPYKPPGNKAYPSRVRERFRPFVAELLANFWKGDRVITLGTEAFQWFARYGEPAAAEAFWEREDRYEADFPCTLTLEDGKKPVSKPLTICPLPHPSPLNQRWYGVFPKLLDQRLQAVLG